MYQYQAISCILAIVGSNTIKRDIGIKNRIDPADESINIKIITVGKLKEKYLKQGIAE